MKIGIVVLLSTLKLQRKSDKSTKNGVTFPDPVKNPSAFPVAININVFIEEKHNSDIFLNPDNLWDIVPAAPMSLNHTNDGYSMSNMYPQPTTHPPRTDSYPVFLHCEGCTVKRRDCASALHFFKEITYQTDK